MEASSLRIAPNALDGPNRHICAFFNGMDEHYRVLQSFITDGFDHEREVRQAVRPHVARSQFERGTMLRMRCGEESTSRK